MFCGFGVRAGHPGLQKMPVDFTAVKNAQMAQSPIVIFGGTAATLLKGRGFRRVAVAQETRLAVRSLEFKGKDWQNVRTAHNRAEKTGVHAVWGRYADFAPALRAQLVERVMRESSQGDILVFLPTERDEVAVPSFHPHADEIFGGCHSVREHP